MAVIKVGIAEMNIARAPDSIVTLGLGSCVGVTLYDERAKVAGMIHVMLPTVELARGSLVNKAKFADSGMPELLKMVLQAGAVKHRLKAKMAGGAQMFNFADKSDKLSIGQKNIEACKIALQQLGIPLLFEDTGGNYGRTIEIFADTGVLEIRSVSKPVKRV